MLSTDKPKSIPQATQYLTKKEHELLLKNLTICNEKGGSNEKDIKQHKYNKRNET